GNVSLEGLGSLAATLLGHSDPDGLLQQGWRCARARRSVANPVARKCGHHARGRIAVGEVAGVREYHLSEVRWPCPPRDGHDGYVRRFVVVLLPLYGSEERPRAVREDDGRLLVPDRS